MDEHGIEAGQAGYEAYQEGQPSEEEGMDAWRSALRKGSSPHRAIPDTPAVPGLGCLHVCQDHARGCTDRRPYSKRHEGCDDRDCPKSEKNLGLDPPPPLK